MVTPRPIGEHLVGRDQTCVVCGVRYASFDECREAPCVIEEAS